MDSRRRIRSTLRMELESVARELEAIEEDINQGNSSDDLLKRKEELEAYHKKLSEQYKQITGKSPEQASRLDTESRIVKKRVSTINPVVEVVILALLNVLSAGIFYNLALQGHEGSLPTDLINAVIKGDVYQRDATVISNYDYSLTIIASTAIVFLILGIVFALMTMMGNNSAMLVDIISMIIMIGGTTYGMILYFGDFGSVYDAIYPYRDGIEWFLGVLAVAGLLKVTTFFVGKETSLFYRIASILEGILLTGVGVYAYSQVQNNVSMTSHYVFTFSWLILVSISGFIKSFFVSN